MRVEIRCGDKAKVAILFYLVGGGGVGGERRGQTPHQRLGWGMNGERLDLI